MRFHVQGRSYQFKSLPFGLSTTPMEFTVVAKEVKLMALQRGIRIHQYLDDWLVRATSHQTCLQHTLTVVALCLELDWLVNKEKSELDQKQVFNFVGYRLDLREGKIRPTLECWQALTDKIQSILSSVSSPTVHVPLRGLLTATEKQVHLGRLHPIPIQWHLKKQLEGPRITRKGDTSTQVAPPSLKMVAGGKQCATRSTITPSKACSADLYRHIKRMVGHSLKRMYCKGKLVPSRKQVAHKSSETKGGLSGLKQVQDLCSNNIVLLATDNTIEIAYINNEGDEVGPFVCPTVENPDLVHQETGNSQSSTHPRLAECDRRQTIQTRPNHSNRMVPSPRGFPNHMLPVAPAASGNVCHQVQQQTATICVTVPDPQAWAVDAVCPGKIWTHMPSHQQPSWAMWLRSCRTTHATESY